MLTVDTIAQTFFAISSTWLTEMSCQADFAPDDGRLNHPRFYEENFHKNLELVDVIRKLAEKKNVTSGQLTLAWILAQGDDFIPIPGTKKIKYLEENVAAVHIKLSEQENSAIRKAIEAAEVAGERYPPGNLELVLLDTPPKN
jgi:aryl-alcohol dehydrogenase-like predicted oxidoreductase